MAAFMTAIGWLKPVNQDEPKWLCGKYSKYSVRGMRVITGYIPNPSREKWQ